MTDTPILDRLRTAYEFAAVAADNLMVEASISRVEGTLLPMHMLCLRDMGLMLGECWDLTALADDCAADGVYEFQLIGLPLSRWGRGLPGEFDRN